MLRVLNTTCRLAASRVRSFSGEAASEKRLVITEVDDKTGYATVTLNRPKVNSLDLEVLKALSGSLEDLQRNKSRGMILTSSLNTVFSAGLDIMEMYKPNHDRLREFWSTLQDVWLKLYGSPFPTVAAINGHAPAGGCLLSVSCEYRVMCPNYTIGLNETQVGILPPPWIQASLRSTISLREAELALTLGKMYTTEEALKVGMIDEIADSKENAIERATNFLYRFRNISPTARAMTIQALRRKDIEKLEGNRKSDIDLFVNVVTQPIVQKGLGVYMESLKKKAAQKATNQ